MHLVRDLSALPDALRRGAVSIGNFDGVHLGHARIVARLLEMAREVDGPAVVLSFDPHPVRLLRPTLAPAPLTWTDRKAELLAELGVDALIAYPTSMELLRLTPGEFFQSIVQGALDARAMVEGPNFRFGRDRAGTINVLRTLCEGVGIALAIVEPVIDDAVHDAATAVQSDATMQFVSSSRVRELITAGDVIAARNLLTKPYRIRGMVTHGQARGAQIGFPTANLEGIDTLLPGYGVYAGRATPVMLGDARTSWPAAINIGPNPTFGEHVAKVEVHLIGVEVSLYGQLLEVDFLARLRDIHTFANVDSLREQLSRDIDAACRIASSVV